MKTWIKCLFFVMLITLSMFTCLASFRVLLIGGVVAIIILTISLFYNKPRSFMGYLGFEVGINNNARLYIIGLLSLFCLIGGLKYGAGEPLFLSAWRNTLDVVETSNMYKEKGSSLQTLKNKIMYGLEKTDQQLNREKSYIKQSGLVAPPKEKSNETPEVYNQKMRNYLVYGVFIDDLNLTARLNSIPFEFQAESSNKVVESKRTWIFWKLHFMFTFLFLLYLPFALSDEVADLLERMVEGIKIKRQEYGAKVTPQVAPQAATAAATPGATTTPPASGLGEKLNVFASRYFSDLAAAATVETLEFLMKFLRK